MDTIKAAISLRRNLFDQAERTAHQLNVSRSRLYSMALEEYLRQCEAQAMFESYNAAYEGSLDSDEKEALEMADALHSETLEDEIW